MHFLPTVIAKAFSDYSGKIQVVEGLGFRHLSTDSIQHSGGIVHQIWSTTLKSRAQKNKSWLVLGVAGGSVIKLISQKYHPKHIVGVDIDPIIVDFGNKYFDLNKIPHLEIKIANANNYLLTTTDTYDYILVDLFGRNSCPSFVYTEKFLKKLSQISNYFIINHLYHTPSSIASAHKLEKKLTSLHLPFHTQKILKNIVFIGLPPKPNSKLVPQQYKQTLV